MLTPFQEGLAQRAKGLLAQPDGKETCGGGDDPGSSASPGRPDRHACKAGGEEQKERSQRRSAGSCHRPESSEAVEAPGYTVPSRGP